MSLIESQSGAVRWPVGKLVIGSTVAMLWGAMGLTLWSQIHVGYSKSSWQFSDWLINYQGGFVRRGLLGQLLLVANQRFGLDPYVVVLVVTLGAYVLLCALAVIAAKKGRIPYALVPMSFALGFPVFSNQWFRKDVLLVLLFILALTSLRLENRSLRFSLVNAVACFAILCHEAFVFIGLPALIVCSMLLDPTSGNSGSFRLVQSLKFLSPALLVGLIVFAAKGNSQTAVAIWDSWKSVSFLPRGFAPPEISGGGPQAAIESIGWSSYRGFEITRGALKTTYYGIPAIAGWALTLTWVFFTAVAVASRKAAQGQAKLSPQQTACIIGLVFAGTLPLYVIGLDYGRWIFLCIGVSFSTICLVPVGILAPFLDRVMSNFGSRISKRQRVSGFVSRLSTALEWSTNKSSLFIVGSLFLAVPPAYWEAYESLMPVTLFVRGIFG